MIINKTYRLYVFDLDGTLADTKEDIGRAIKRVLEEAGFKPPSDQEVVSAIGGGARNALNKLTGIEGEALEPYAAAFMDDYYEMCCDNVKLYAGACELLHRLKRQGAVLALVTMKFRSATDRIINALGIDIFDEVIAFENAPKRKPDPETLLMMMQKFDVPSEKTLMVGDSMTDALYANAAGVDICIMEHGYGNMAELAAIKPAYMLKSFLEF